MEEDVQRLTENLKRENNFVKRERSLIQSLFVDLLKSFESLFHDWWILQAQRETVLAYLQSVAGESAHQLSRRFFDLDNVQFVRAFNLLQYDEFRYVDLIKLLRRQPYLTARLLIHTQDVGGPVWTQHLCFVLFTGVYGNCLCPEDDESVVRLLHHLIRLQVAPSTHPRKLLLNSTSCAFTRLLRIYVENMASAKRYLTAVLYQPIVQLLVHDDWYLDISPVQMLERFQADYKRKRFGSTGTDEYTQKVGIYRTNIVRCLASLAGNFVTSLRQTLFLFPPTYLQLMSYLGESVARAGHLGESEVRAMCSEFVFECFLYPAIVDPETYGVTSDFAISSIARHNLMEVGKIMQTLVYHDGRSLSPSDLYSHFPPDSLTRVMSALLSTAHSLTKTPTHKTPPVRRGSGDGHTGEAEGRLGGMALTRSVALLTPNGLNLVVSTLRSLLSSSPSDDLYPTSHDQRESLSDLLDHLPAHVPGCSNLNDFLLHSSNRSSTLTSSLTTSNEPAPLSPSPRPIKKLMSRNSSTPVAGSPGGSVDDLLSPELSPDTALSGFTSGPIEDVLVFSLDINSDTLGLLSEEKVLSSESDLRDQSSHSLATQSSISSSPPPSLPGASLHHRSVIIHTPSEPPRSSSTSSRASNATSTTSSNAGSTQPPTTTQSQPTSNGQPPLPSSTTNHRSGDQPSMQQPQQLKSLLAGGSSIAWVQSSGGKQGSTSTRVTSSISATMTTSGFSSISSGEQVEKRTRFSLSNDHEALGSTADNLEAVSEVAASEIASTHSAPSVDLESQEETDALSDMLSANVSGRGTPSIISGGRDSPLSGTDLPVNVPKNDVTDKFGKFDIPPSRPGEIEARSTVSDTWSTDVLASDSETTEAIDNQQQRLVEITEESSQSSHHTTPSLLYPRGPTPRGLPPGQPIPARWGVVLPPTSGGEGRGSGSRWGGGSSIGETTSEDHWSVDAHCDTEDKTSERMGDFDPDELEEADERHHSHERHRLRHRGAGNQSSSSLHSQSTADRQGGEDDMEDQRSDVDDEEGHRDPLSMSTVSGPAYPGGASGEEQVGPSIVLATSQDDRPRGSASTLPVQPQMMGSVGGAFTAVSKTVPPGQDKSAPPQEKRGSRGSGFLEGLSKFKEKIGKSNTAGRRKKASGNEKESDVVVPPNASTSTTRSSEPLIGPEKKAVPTNENAFTVNGGAQRESVEDMMARYKRKVNASSNQPSVPASSSPTPSSQPLEHDNTPDFFDPDNVENCPAWFDTKRKLRLVLCACSSPSASPPVSRGGVQRGGDCGVQRGGDCGVDLSVVSRLLSSAASDLLEEGEGARRGGFLVRILMGHLADAINLQDYDLRTQVQETLRVVRLFDAPSLHRLVRSMVKDWKKRRVYLSYLVRTRDQLGLAKQHATEFVKRCSRNRWIATRHMVSLCVRDLLREEASHFNQFASQFDRAQSRLDASASQSGVTEERQNLVLDLVHHVTRVMHETAFYRAAREESRVEADRYLERVVMSQIYRSTMAINDILAEKERDQIFQRELQSLAMSLSLSDLHIPAKYSGVSPFESAQEELLLINSYKTPADKVECVKRVNDNIINMLRMANSNLIPCADDLLPVLVFVVIHANPPRLLSNISYVETFYSDRLDGVRHYVWCQFSAAVEEVKKLISDAAIKSLAKQ